MPFTPFHFGPAFLVKSASPKKFSFMVFFLTQIIIDLESLRNMMMGYEKVHTFFHTYLGSLVVVILVTLIYEFHYYVQKAGFKISVTRLGLNTILISALIGAWSHVFLDSIMHFDIEPFWPFSILNPLYQIITIVHLHIVCVICGLVGIGTYFIQQKTLKKFLN